MRTMMISIQCIILATFSTMSLAETDSRIREKMREIDRERHELEHKLRDEMRELEKSDSLAGQRKTVDKHSRAYREKVDKDRAVIAARKNEDRARDDLRAIVTKKLTDNPGAKKIRTRLEKMENQRMDLEHQKNLTRFRLTDRYSPVQRELKKDVRLQELKKRVYGLKESKDRIRALGEYRKAEKLALAKMPAAKILLGQIMQFEGRIEMVEKAARETREKADELRQEVERSEDPDILRARKKCDEARKALSKTYESKELQDARKKEFDARRALRAEVEKLATKNSRCKPLIKKIADLKKKRDELRK